MPAPGLALARRPAKPRAPTASVATAATVMAVPSPITKVEATPIQNSPCASANTRTMIAPEQGRKPTATMAARPRRSQCWPGKFARLRRMRVAPGRGLVLAMVMVVMVVIVAVRMMVRMIVMRMRFAAPQPHKGAALHP